ncbi:MAG: hypothetical protein JSS02_16915, partial [Planctomycetes bacterium]|nr:hypothetical protein [Planctomycetota bacterium]
VNGWPAAFTCRFGRGHVLVTTLAPRAWYRPITLEESRAQQDEWNRSNRDTPGMLQDSPYIILPPMKHLSTHMHRLDSRPPEIDRELSSYAAEYIGYAIPSQGIVAGLLAAFAAVVAGGGAWLWRKQALEHLGWFGPVVGVLTAVALLVVGVNNRHEKEPSVATVQLIDALPGVDDANLTGGLAFFSPESADWKLQSHQGGRSTPDMAGLEGQTRRLVWNDMGEWSWDHLQLETPQRTAVFRQALALTDRIEASATFDSAGLSGQFGGTDPARLSETVLVTRDGRIGVDLRPDGHFSASNVFGVDQYVQAGLLGDEQDRRRRMYPLVISELINDEWDGTPLLMAWTNETTNGLDIDEKLKRVGASVYAVPVRLERPAPGAEFTVPAPFLPFRLVDTPFGESRTPSSPMWDSRRREWAERRDYSMCWLRFQVPAAVRNSELTDAKLVVSVAGPVIQMEVFGLANAGTPTAEPVLAERWNDPVGAHTFTISDRALLSLVEGQDFYLGLHAGDPNRRPDLTRKTSPTPANPAPNPAGTAELEEIKSSQWRIVHLELQLTGKIPAANPDRP